MTVRMDDDLKARMKRAGRKLRMSSSTLIRLGLVKTLSEMEAGTFRCPSTAESQS